MPGPHAVYRHLYVQAIRRVVGGFIFRSLLAGYKETISHHTHIFPALLRYSGRSKLMQFYININVFSIKFDHCAEKVCKSSTSIKLMPSLHIMKLRLNAQV